MCGLLEAIPIRAAEKLFPLIKPELNIHFLILPKDQDPDSYVNQKGKDSFLQLAEKKLEISNSRASYSLSIFLPATILALSNR